MMIILALAPAVILIFAVYQKDRLEKEPVGLLLKLFLFGALTTVSAIILELFGSFFLALLVEEGGLFYCVVDNFLITALTEEGGKYFVLKKATWNEKEFNYTFDSIVYSVVISLGFAAIENMLYLLGETMDVAIMRALLSVPGHAIFAVYMGYYYGYAKYCEVRGNVKSTTENLRKALFIPVFIHGFYDFCIEMNNGIFLVVFFIFMIAISIGAAKKAGRVSKGDVPIAPFHEWDPGAR